MRAFFAFPAVFVVLGMASLLMLGPVEVVAPF